MTLAQLIERADETLAKLNADMMKENPDYVVRITGGDLEGKNKLPYFISGFVK